MGGSLGYLEIPVIHTVVSENSNHFVKEEKFVWLKPLVSAGYQYRQGVLHCQKQSCVPSAPKNLED